MEESEVGVVLAETHEMACSPMSLLSPKSEFRVEPEPEAEPVLQQALEAESERLAEPEPVREDVVSQGMSPIPAMTPKQYDIIEIQQDLTNEEMQAMQETYQ